MKHGNHLHCEDCGSGDFKPMVYRSVHTDIHTSVVLTCSSCTEGKIHFILDNHFKPTGSPIATRKKIMERVDG